MSNYRRARLQDGCYFFTVVLNNRNSSLLVEHIDLLRAAMRFVKAKHPFEIDAIVVLPEHLHCIWTLPEGDENFSLRWRQIKADFSSRLPVTESRSESRVKKNERGIWQRRFWEHAIRDEADYENHLNYIYFNPVKHGLVDAVVDWPYSSFHRDVELGVYPVSWGDGYIESVGVVGE